MSIHRLLPALAAALFLFSVLPAPGQKKTQLSEPVQKTSKDIYGKVTDSAGEPVPGAFVFYNMERGGQTHGVSTDLDGNYSISIIATPHPFNLVFQFIGLQTQERLVSGPGRLDVVMTADNTLDEVVVVGYGLAHKREDLVGSAFQVTNDDLKFKPAARVDDMLAGVVPGMNVIEETTNGRPSVKIRIRGDGSLSASNEPLWIIDGVPIYNGGKNNYIAGANQTISPISFMNPDDIESMTVLKDASTVALYGADGSNGVILVTTKKAQSGALSVNASVRVGYTDIDPSTRLKYLDAEGWMKVAKEAWVNSGRDLSIFPYQDNEYQTFTGVNTVWYDYYQRPGKTLQANVSVSGGSDRMNNMLSIGAYAQQSPYIGNAQQRFTLRENSVVKFSDKFSANVILDASYNYNDMFSSSSYFDEFLPIFEPYNPDGTYRWYNYYSNGDKEYNVVPKKFYTYIDERDLNTKFSKALNLKAALTLNWKPTDYLSFTSQTSGTFMGVYEASYSSRNTLSGMNTEDTSKAGSSTRGAAFDYDFFQKFHANFDKTFGGRHKVTAMAGWEWRNVTHPYLSATGYGFVNDSIQEVSYSSYPDLRRGTSNISYRKSLSYIAAASYGYARRYNVSVNYRRQGNSAFSEFARWSDFGSVGGGWNIHREHWFKPGFFDKISMKLTFGTAGNSRVDASTSYGAYSLSSGYYYGTKPGAIQSSTPNPALHWERTYKTDFQLILGFLNRFSLTVEPYRELTTDVLYKARVSSIIDSGGIYQNIGEIANNGIEFIFDSTNIQTKDFTWSTSINGARNRNMIEKLYGDAYTGFFDTIWIEGQSKDAYWLVNWAGVDPVTGDPMWYDKNGDLTYTFSYEDRVFQPYSSQPDLYGGVSNDFRYKNWNLRIMFDYTIGGWLYELLHNDGRDALDDNQPVEALDHWTTPGEGSLSPAFIHNGTSHTYYNSTRCLWRKDSIQLRSVSLTYSLPKRICQKMRIKSCAFSLIGNNLYFWSPGQSRTHNSYKTIRFGSQGMRREFSLQASFNF